MLEKHYNCVHLNSCCFALNDSLFAMIKISTSPTDRHTNILVLNLKSIKYPLPSTSDNCNE